VNRKTNNKKQKKILFLAIVSQLILSVFVVYWLIGQFNDEKKQLEKDLLHQYLSAEDQVVDSILLRRVINPVLGDSMKMTIKMSADTTKILRLKPNPSLANLLIKNHSTDSNNRVIAIGYVADEDSSANNKKVYHFNKLVSEDALKRSVKLIINHTNSVDAEHVIYRRPFPFPLDRGLFKRIFSDSLNDKKMCFTMDWYFDSDSAKTKTSGINISGGFYDNVPSVSISKYGGYIIRKILPQFLFAFFLLILSGAALTFSYRSFKKQVQLNILRADFISNITHELKTPVSTAKVALEALLNFDMKKDAEVADKYLKMVSVEMNRLDVLTNKVLSHSKLESQGVVINKEKTNLPEFVSNVLMSMQTQFAQFNAVVVSNELEEELIVEIDRFYIEGVLINLLDNSMKYAAPNPQIEVKTSQKNGTVLLSISDNGPGIPEEYLSKVFDKFFRVPTGNKHDVKGYGLGLSFASMVMKQHKGEISVENLAKNGCRFTLKFPT